MTRPDATAHLADLLSHGVVACDTPQPCPVPDPGALWLVPDAETAPTALHAVSAPLRAVLRDSGLPLADPAALGVLGWIAAQKRLPERLVVSMPAPPATAQTWRFVTRSQRSRLQQRALMLHEERRQALGLSARRPEAEIAAAIRAAYLLPRLQQQLSALLPEGVTLQVTDAAPPADARTEGYAPLAAQPTDPLSDNPFALAIRTGFFGPHRAALQQVFRLSPGRFGGALRRAGRAEPPDLRTALLIPQFALFPALLPCEASHA